MLGMEIDSPPKGDVLSPQDRIVQRLASIGVPEEILKQLQPGLVAYVQNNRFRIPTVVSAIFPTDEEAIEAVSEAQSESTTYVATPSLEDHFNESISWLQWLMFEGEPLCALKHLAKLNVGQRGVCGAVWGNNDIAYRCRTCEHDPTCAICVPCFQNGNHKDHDYSIIYTGGGCCDCGDVTAWKREGFCSKHKGAEQIQPLSEEFVNSVGPVLDSLLPYWKNKLLFAEAPSQSIPRTDFHVDELKQVSDELTSAVVKMLLEFCNYSESLLSFVSGRLCSSVGLLDILVRAERFVSENVAKKLHELLLKLLGEPLFKYEFAKVFLNYYPTVIDEAVKECNDTVFKKYQLLSTFSVQIFTVPTLTPRLVKEMDLLSMLLECLGDVFISCAGDDGRLQVVKWGNLYETTLRVVEDIRFVTSHSVVPKYVTRDRRDILRTWMRLLAFVQGMNPQKRETGIHIEEENENMHLPFVLGHSIANIHSLLVAGAFLVGSDEETDDGTFSNTYKQDFEDQDRLRHAKVGRVSQESSVSSVMGRCSSMDSASRAPEIKSDIFPIPSSVLWLTYECLRAIESWLGVDNTSGPLLSVLSPQKNNITGNNFFALKRTLSKIRKGRYIFKSNHSLSSSNKNASSSEGHGRNSSSPSQSGFSTDFESGRSMGQALSPTAVDDVAMDGEYANDLEALRVLSLSDWPDIAHDVSSHDISVHIPLHRLISLVLQKALRRCYGESALPSFSNASFADPSSTIYNEFLGHVLGGCHPYGFSAFVMEHPLRIRVFCAEVHAGMWRKNGDAAILSCEWYRSVRWSEQGLELDLFLLQCCAALAPPDLYVKRILERFGLSSYLNLNLERSSEYEPVLVNEMLTLIIQIVKERRFCGLTTAECLKRELIYKLSIGDATRSQLVKSLPRDLSKLDQLQEVLDAIAVYSNPSGMNQGMYKLRLQCWKELDLYHPRWNSRDLQVAEERYMRFCNVSALTTQLPKWSKIYHPLSAIARIATCKSVLQIVRAVLFYAVFNDDWTASRAPDVVLLTALHLLSLALDICFTQKEPAERSVIPILAYADEVCVNSRYGDQSLLSLLVALMRKHKKENPENFIEAGSFNLASLIENLLKKFAELDSRCFIQLQKDAPEVVNQLLQSIADDNTNVMGSVMEGERRKAKARERQAAILEKMRAQQSKFLESINPDADDGLNGPKTGQEVSSSDDGNDSNESAQVVCSLCHDPKSNNAVSFLVLLQKSRLLSFVDRGPLSWEQVRRSGKEPVVTNTNTVDVPTRFPQARNILLPRTSNNAREKSTCSLETLEDHMYMLIQEGMHNASVHLDTLTENENLSTAQGVPTRSGESDSLLLGKYISALSKETLDSPSVSESTRSHSDRTHSESTKLPTENEAFGPPDCDGIHISSCGHAVHQGCLDRYLSSLKERYIRRIVFEGGQIVDPDQGEFLCPVCRGLANSVLPALPGDSKKAGQLQLTPIIRWPDSADALSFSNRAIDPLRLRHALSLFQSAAEVAGREEILRLLPIQLSGRMRTSLDSIFRLLCGLYFPGKDKVTGSGRVTHPMILWDTLRYSLVSTEIAARSRRTSLAPEYSFVAIFKELKSSSGFILSLLHKIVQSTKNKSTVSAILRLRGTQIFAESICSGVTVDELPTSTSRQRGEMLFILDDADDDVRYPDMQFWKWASHPILARDAFSSLMWVLFCLPSQFLSCEESFLSLVHIFYAVSIAQAIITYCRKHQGDMTEISYHDCLITDISKIIGESGVAQYFVSNYFDPACDIKDTIRSLTFPFLRRCALLWKLINSSSSAPFHDGAQVLDRLSSHGDDDKMECTSTLPELVEVEELEKVFSIPPLDVVINDQTLRSLVRKWLNHLSNECEVRRLKFVMHSTPAAPFKLMILPDIYQDLLQRYIKQCCPDCGVIQEEPALCLLCGKVCSPHWKPCCRESGCQSHALACGAGTGVFLLIRRTTILLQRSARQAPWPSPYLDAFGEEDIEMHRGKPLYLNEERYAALTHMVASHGLDRSSKVLRQTTIASFFML